MKKIAVNFFRKCAGNFCDRTRNAIDLMLVYTSRHGAFGKCGIYALGWVDAVLRLAVFYAKAFIEFGNAAQCVILAALIKKVAPIDDYSNK